MAILEFPVAAHKKLRTYAEKICEADSREMCKHYEALAAGVFEELARHLPNMTVCLLMLDFDEFKEGRSAFTETVPHVCGPAAALEDTDGRG